MFELERKCTNEIERCYLLAEKAYGRTFHRVPVTFSKRMTSTAGKAFFMYNNGVLEGSEIRLSGPLLQLNGDEFVNRTPAHETAHIIAAEQFGDRGHGPGWKAVMALFGTESSRCHSMKTATSKFEYVASCGTKVQVSKIIHNRVQGGQTRVLRKTGGIICSDGYKGVAQ